MFVSDTTWSISDSVVRNNTANVNNGGNNGVLKKLNF